MPGPPTQKKEKERKTEKFEFGMACLNSLIHTGALNEWHMSHVYQPIPFASEDLKCVWTLFQPKRFLLSMAQPLVLLTH